MLKYVKLGMPIHSWLDSEYSAGIWERPLPNVDQNAEDFSFVFFAYGNECRPTIRPTVRLLPLRLE